MKRALIQIYVKNSNEAVQLYLKVFNDRFY